MYPVWRCALDLRVVRARAYSGLLGSCLCMALTCSDPTSAWLCRARILPLHGSGLFGSCLCMALACSDPASTWLWPARILPLHGSGLLGSCLCISLACSKSALIVLLFCATLTQTPDLPSRNHRLS